MTCRMCALTSSKLRPAKSVLSACVISSSVVLTISVPRAIWPTNDPVSDACTAKPSSTSHSRHFPFIGCFVSSVCVSTSTLSAYVKKQCIECKLRVCKDWLLEGGYYIFCHREAFRYIAGKKPPKHPCRVAQ